MATRCTALLICAALAIPGTEAAESSRSGDKPRELLQPPRREVPSPITDRFALRASYYGPEIETLVRLDTVNGVAGTPFEAEKDLGLDDRVDQGTIEMILRMRPRHRLRVDYFKLARHGEQFLTRSIDFGDDSYVIGDQVVSDLDWRMLNLTYSYSLVQIDDRFELGVGLGVHLVEAHAVGAVPARTLREQFDTTAPFPTFAADATWRFTERFSLNARAQRFNADVDDLRGALGVYHFDIQYRWTRNVALAFGYTAIRASFDSEDEEFPGQFRLRTSGLEYSVRVSF